MGADSSKESSYERELRERVSREVREQEYRSRVRYSRAQAQESTQPVASGSNQNESRNIIIQHQQQLYPNLNQETINTRTTKPNLNIKCNDHYPNIQTNHVTNQASGSKSMPAHANIPTARPRPTVNVAQSAAAVAKAPSPMVAAAKAPPPNTEEPRGVAAQLIESHQIGYLRLTPTAPPASDVLQKNIRKKIEKPKKVRNPRSKSASKPWNNQNITTPLSNDQNRNYEVIVTCCTCNGNFGLEIYQCENGHSSCHRCKGRLCKDCLSIVTDMRNFVLEDSIAKVKVPCENNKHGCQWKIALSEMESHLKECPFGDMACPVNNVIGSCFWKGKLSQMASHLQENHSDVAFSDVDKEMLLPSICYDSKVVSFVELGNFRFIVHLQVSVETRNIYMTVQLMGPKKSASNWTYELHVYNKREPRRKFTFNDKCHGIATPIQEIVDENCCAVLAIPLAMTYVNEGAITYKFYITKSTNENWCGGGARRKQPADN